MWDRPTTMRTTTALATLLLLGAGCSSPEPAAPAPLAARDLAVTEASERVLATLGAPEVVDIHPDFIPSPGNENRPTLVVEVWPGPRSPAARGRLGWIGQLAGYAVAALSSSGIDGVRVVEVLPSGDTRELAGDNISQVEAGQVFASEGRSDVEVVADVTAAVEDFGLVVDSVEVLHPIAPAVDVVAVLPDGVEVDWTLTDLMVAVNGETAAYEGLAIEIDAADGSPLIVSTQTERRRSGGAWWAPGQDEVFGLTILGVPPTRP